MRFQWTTQNEEIDADRFLLKGAASFAAEMELLRSVGCPDTTAAILVSVEALRQAESQTIAEVSASIANWLEAELDGEPVN